MAGPPRRGLDGRRALGAGLLVAALVAVLGLAWWGIGAVVSAPPPAPGAPVEVVIPPGATGAQIGEILAEAGVVGDAGAFVCRRTGRPGTKMASAPMRGALGAWIVENISQETWRQWIGQGTKVINELRLDFTRDRDQEIYDQHMREYLGIDDEALREIAAVK